MGHAVVYVIDDDDAVRASTRALLESEGYTVVEFASCEEFLRRPADIRPSGIILDVHMPRMNGLDLLDHLGIAEIGLPLVVTTGRSDRRAIEAASRARALLLEKPYRADDLLKALRAGPRDPGATHEPPADPDR